MKKIFSILICSLFFFFISCSIQQNKELIGTWELNRLLKTELNDKNNENKIIGYMYIYQSFYLTLEENGTYTKKIVQNFKNIEWTETGSEIINNYDNLKNELTSLNQEYVILGSYYINKNQILFSPNFLLSDDGEKITIESIKDFLPQLVVDEQRFYNINDSQLHLIDAFNGREIFSLVQEQ